jgi:hypothetical protein
MPRMSWVTVIDWALVLAPWLFNGDGVQSISENEYGSESTGSTEVRSMGEEKV